MPSPRGTHGGADYDGEDPTVKGFDDANIRRGFIRKVYSILCAQLSVTVAFIAWFLYHEPTKQYAQSSVRSHPAFLIVCIVTMLVALFILACCGEVRRTAPINFILLSIFTLAQAFLLAVTSSIYEVEEVLMAVGITAAVCLGLTLFAFQTKWDFTIMGGILLSAIVILIISAFLTMFVHNKVVKLLYASAGALVFSVYLIYDTQLMLDGDHKYTISPEEYIFAALNLYVDIINIFIYILSIISDTSD